MMKQYFDIKKQHSEHIVFFRLGDFYEMFFDDAITVSRELELTLTGRDCGLAERAPMCGVPYHSAENYIKRLIDLGYRVAVCEQITDPKDSKGIVEREVVKIVTPGTLIESNMLDEAKNNFLAAISVLGDSCSICFADISTGEVHLFSKSGKEVQTEVINELARFLPVEILFNAEFLNYKEAAEFIKNKLNASVQLLDDECFDSKLKGDSVLQQFSAGDFSEIGLKEGSVGLSCVCGLFEYIRETQKALIGRFTEIKHYTDNIFMGLDLTARRNLELTETMRNKEKKGSLLWVLDYTKTSMGKRLLKTYIEQPLLKPAMIINRLEAVEQLCARSIVREELRGLLSGVYDLERLMTKVMYKSATPRDLKALSLTARTLPEIKRMLEVFTSKLLREINGGINTLENVAALIEAAVLDDAPATVKDGGVIKDGFNEELDRLRSIVSGGEEILREIEAKEREKTGIKNLKLGYNRVFGYYIEVTKSYYNLVPVHYTRRQTLASCERFITEDLKKAEYEILGANNKIIALEQSIFNEVRERIAEELVRVQETAAAVAKLDVFCSFAHASMKNEYSRPDITADGALEIRAGRHPVVELMLTENVFVPNDVYLNQKDYRMLVVTGPNMSGKSTYMRQTALIVLMAQIGCFVPAKYAKLSVIDKIFTRVGASDDLTAGQSTFMVEMSEVADILKNATPDSLCILDEVGRGTSTFDGISIAKAVAEYIASHRSLSCKTLFATHYHELIQLENELEGVKNFSVAVKKRGENIRFLHKIVPGGVDDSYGIEVAKLAGIPPKVISRAKQLLEEMERGRQTPPLLSGNAEAQISFGALNSDRVADRLRKTNIDELTDEDAKYMLRELVEML
ncbi:MAG: DNA mismatch repair protein MutS [Oscillospiraceae bacterium]|nr:DNA mismatch repair protein MutS [Oscillospiraceae bacterium]